MRVLDEVDLRIPAGDKVALVGETEGQALFDGVDARDLDLASLRAQIGHVSQDRFIFTGTIRDHVALGEPLLAQQGDCARAQTAVRHG